MHGPRGVQHVRSAPGGIQGAGNLLADVGRLSGAGDADPPGTRIKQLNRPQERFVEPPGRLFESRGFRADHLAGVLEPVRCLFDRNGIRYLQHTVRIPASTRRSRPTTTEAAPAALLAAKLSDYTGGVRKCNRRSRPHSTSSSTIYGNEVKSPGHEASPFRAPPS